MLFLLVSLRFSSVFWWSWSADLGAFRAKTAEEIQVVYGGSVQPEFATDYAKIKGVDGLLIGGASLSVEKFAQITQKVFETIK